MNIGMNLRSVLNMLEYRYTDNLNSLSYILQINAYELRYLIYACIHKNINSYTFHINNKCIIS